MKGAPETLRVLVVEELAELRRLIADLLRSRVPDCSVDFLEKVEAKPASGYGLLVLGAPRIQDGLRQVKELWRDLDPCPVLLLSCDEVCGLPNCDHPIRALQKPFALKAFQEAIEHLAPRCAGAPESGEGSLVNADAMSFDSTKTRSLLAELREVATSNACVLFRGETGSGKEFWARYLHDHSARSRGPFVPVNCGGVSKDLVGSEMFGHVKGAFTGAVHDQSGLAIAADRGTLFLDEVGNMLLENQANLLRFLQDHEVRPVGSVTSKRVDLRVLAATNADLEAMVEDGAFRKDLYYRLRTIQIEVPPLREHPEDIPGLLCRFLEEIGRRDGKRPTMLSAEVMEALQQRAWPGNVRELQNLAEAVMSRRLPGRIHVADLPTEVDRLIVRLPSAPKREPSAPVTRVHVEAAIRQAGGNKAKAARILGISREYLYQLLRK